MSRLPDYEPQLLIPGPYCFEITEEPEVKKTSNKNTYVQFKMRATDPAGRSRSYKTVLWPSEETYQNILLAIGGKRDASGRVHLSETLDIVGSTFEADIVHVPDRQDASRMRDRIANVKVQAEGSDPEGDIPF